MPVARSADHPTFDVERNAVTGIVSPSRGSTECILYRIDVPPGGKLPPHRHDHEDTFTLLEGSATANLDGDVLGISVGDAVIVPTGVLHWVQAGPAGCVMLVTMLAGTLFIPQEGEAAVPPWGV